MHLHWIFDIPNYRLSCKVNDELTYVAIRGGVGGIEKHYQGTATLITYDLWPTEFVWLKETYPNMPRPKYTPVDDADYEDIKSKNPYHPWHDRKFYPYGINAENQILDRLGRPGNLQSNFNNCMFQPIFEAPDVGYFESYDGINFYLRAVNPGDDGAKYYNRMPCCVFPDNPGMRRATDAELEQYNLIEKAKGMTFPQPSKMIADHFVLP
jgi:hypothetical protein